jgi:ankyrin repeat protein
MTIGKDWLRALLLVGLGTGIASAQTPLTEAAKNSDIGEVRALISEGMDANDAEVDGTSALHWAAHRDALPIAALLIDQGANVTATNRYGVTPISVAAVNGSAAMIALLLDAGADPNTTLPEGETALMTAARTGVLDAVQLLLNRGADVNAQETWRGQTALMWAAGEGHADIMQVLIENGADVAVASNGGFTALLFAAREGQISAVRTLLEANASTDEALPRRGRSGDLSPGLNPFMLAASNAHYELAALLLDRGADANAAPLGWTALHQVSWVRKAGIAGSNNPAPGGSGNMDSLEFVRKLIASGADPNRRVTERPPAGITSLNMIGGTPFLLAARTADIPLMRLLVDLGADPLLANEDNATPLLVAAGVGTSSPGEDPGTELEVMQAVQLALDLGGDINHVDDNGETVMHGAAYKHVPSVFQYLAEQGADVEIWNRENSDGWTPLEITDGVHRGMNIISSPVTEAAVRDVLERAGVAVR